MDVSTISLSYYIWVGITAIIILGVLLLFHRHKTGIGQTHNNYVSGLNYLIDGNTDKAIEALKKSIRQDTGNIDAYLKLGILYRERNNFQQALKIHKELTVRRTLQQSQLVAIYEQLAEDYIALNQFEQALEIVDKMLQIDRSMPAALAQKVQLHKQLGQWKDAFDTLKKNSKKDDAAAVRAMADVKMEQAKHLISRNILKEARIVLKEALKLDPELAEAYLLIGQSYIMENRQDDAIKTWKKCIQDMPRQSAQIFGELEKALYDAGNFGAIENVYQFVTQQDPDNIHAWLKLGEFYFKKGEREEAIRMVESVISQHPHALAAYKLLIRFYESTGDYEKVHQYVDQLFEILPDTLPVTHSQSESTSNG